MSTKSIKQHTTLLDIEGSQVDGRFASGKTLKREYVVTKRKEFLDDVKNVFRDSADEESKMNDWKNEATILYPNMGDYKILLDGTIVYLGEF